MTYYHPMLRVIIRRLLWFIPVFFLATGITFATMHALPGGPFDSDKTPPALVRQMEATFGLRQLLYKQYAIWLGNVLQLKFGPSLAARGKPVGSFLLPGLAVSAQLGAFALLFALAIGLPAGILAALKRGQWQAGNAHFDSGRLGAGHRLRSGALLALWVAAGLVAGGQMGGSQ